MSLFSTFQRVILGKTLRGVLRFRVAGKNIFKNAGGGKQFEIKVLRHLFVPRARRDLRAIFMKLRSIGIMTFLSFI